MSTDDSIVDRAGRVEHSLHQVGDPTARAAVGGPCPACGSDVETTLSAETTTITCDACHTAFTVQ